jgi:S-DNA-T family DNA segregation ATPase FtsK/SpoIIIE
MSYRLLNRPARDLEPGPAPEVRTLATPPPAPAPPGAGRGIAQAMVPAMGGLGMVLFLVANGNPLFLLAGAVMVAAMVGGGLLLLAGQRSGGRRQLRLVRERYAAHVEAERELLRAAGRAQAAHAARVHPHPGALAGLAGVPGRLWERRPADPDFLDLRLGLGTVPRLVSAVVPEPATPLEVHDPVCRRAAELLVAAHTGLPGQPVTVPLADATSVSVAGPAEEALVAGRLLVAQLAALHSPAEVRLAVCCPPAHAPAWDWVKWLPHLLAAAATPAELRAELGDELAARADAAARTSRLGGRATPADRIVVVVDETAGPLGAGFDADEAIDDATAEELGLTVVRLVPARAAEPGRVDVRVEAGAGRATVERPGSEPLTCTLDDFGPAEAEALALALAPLRLAPEATPEAAVTATTELPGLLGLADPAAADPAALWRRGEREHLRVPIGVKTDGRPLVLDLKEPALGGMGPHGLCVGATGSGKSELLRTLVLGLAMTHAPERLALLLVDYKGGATFAGLEGLPHTAGLITNLSDDLGLVDRMRDALFGELRRRQQLLLEAGNLPNLTEYERRRAGDPALEPLPSLIVVVDEFAELLSAKPDFIELFVAIGRIGRSIGVHQLLASQRLEEGRLRGLEANLSYRIALRTFTAGESRAVLGVPDAFELPPLPGSAYLKVDTTVFERFKAAYVSARHVPGGPPPEAAADPVCEPFELFDRTPVAAPAEPEAPAPAPATGVPALDVSVLDVVAARLAGAGAAPVRRIWLPPLPAALPLDAVTGAPVEDPARGLRVGWAGGLRVPVGLLDLPARQAQEPFVLDLSGPAGHLAVLGAPRSGKSGLLRTLVTAAALTHTPAELAFHCVDLGGGALAPLAELPHVGTVSGRADPDRVRRTVHELAGVLDERERLFAAHGIDEVETMRARRRADELPGLVAGDVVLVIDNYPALKADYEDLADLLADLAGRGLAYGVHLVLTAPRWNDLRPALQTAIGGRVELRLADPLDSIVDRRLAAAIPPDRPGRCVSDRRLLGQIALPRVDGVAAVGDLAPVLTALGRRATAAWPGPPVPPVRLLPALVRLRELPAAMGDGVPIGLGEEDLRPVLLDLFGEDGSVIVFGDQGSGKTAFLRTLVAAATERWSDDEIVFAVFDPRRGLLDAVPGDYLGSYAPTPAAASGFAEALAAELRRRLPGDQVTVAQLRERSWWEGPEIVVLVDDLDLLTGGPGGANPLAPLLPFLPQARDLGLHVVVTRHSGGAGRALFEPFLQRLRELGATGLVLSGDRQEGQLWPGLYPSPLPPGRARLARRGRQPALIQIALPN